MSHLSPACYLVWAILTSLLGAFLIFHLWSFDRFQSFKWNSGTGAFKRVMTYTYILSIPVLFSFIFGFVVIKYREGFIETPVGIVPKPYFLWTESSKNAIFPLMFMFSVGWSLELVTHLEELCFWLFLLNASSIQRSWFQSPYFKTWVIGSIVAIIYMPLITVFTRSEPLKNEAYAFLGGSLGSLSLTIWFLPILWAFPSFLDNLRSEGVDTATIVRLTKFSELNTIRVVFRFLFSVPIVILGVDGVRPHVHINDNIFATDLLVMVSAVGVVVSSAITLVIFFPRSIEGEIAARDVAKERKRLRREGSTTGLDSRMQISSRTEPSATGSYLLTNSPIKQDWIPSLDTHENLGVPYQLESHWTEKEREALPPLRPNRRMGNDIELGLTASNLPKHNLRFGNVNPMVTNYISPIDIANYSNNNGARLTFTRR